MLNRNAFGTVEIEGVGTYNVELLFKTVRPDPSGLVTWSVFDGYVNGVFIGEYSAAQGCKEPDIKSFLVYACEDASDARRFSFREWKLKNGIEDGVAEEVHKTCVDIRERLLKVISSDDIDAIAEEALRY